MSIKQAIYYFDGYGSPYDEMVMGALGKQAIKRVKFIAHYGEGFYKGTCPGCGLFIKRIEGVKYCQHCGQRIEWGLKK